MPRFSNTPLIEKFDKDGNGRLEEVERVPARAFLAELRGTGGGSGGGSRFGRSQASAKKTELSSRQISKADVISYPDKPLYDLGVIRTVFLVVRRIGLAVAAKVKMRSRGVTFRLCDVASMMRVRKAQALVGQHQKNEQ